MFPLYDENRPLTRPYVNYGLIAVNVLVFLFFFLQGWETLIDAFFTYGAIPAYILRGSRLWTLFTSMFMHGDIMHLVSNMVFLWIFGDNIEDSLGHRRYLAFYLLGGLFADFAHIGSTLLSAYTSQVPYFVPDLNIPSLGASGAISAVLGAYFLLYPQARIRTLVFYIYVVTVVRIPAFFYLGFWFLYQFVMGLGLLLGSSSGVAFWAHIGGWVCGMIAVKAFGIEPRRKPFPAQQERPVRPMTAPWVITPLVDILLEEDRVRVLAEIPGVQERDIRIQVSEWRLVISAEYTDIRFYKEVDLPVPVIPKPEYVIYRNGVLSFTLYRAL